jgi:PAS domain S-box-containing protein
MRDVILRIVSETSGVEGEAFFVTMVKTLAEVLQTDHAFIGEIIDPSTRIVRTRAFWSNGRQAENIEYKLDDTPCEKVIQSGLCVFQTGVSDEFPKDELLREMGIEAYVGIPLVHNDTEIGLISFMHTKPFHNVELAESILNLLSSRTVLEIERAKREEALQLSEQKFRDIANLMPLVVYELDSDGYLTYVNPQGLVLSGHDEESIQKGVHIFDLLQLDQQALAQANLEAILSGKEPSANDYRITRPDGTEAPIRVVSQPIMSDGIAVGLRGVVMDMSDHERVAILENELETAKIMLKTHEERENMIINSLDSSISELNRILAHTSSSPELKAQATTALDSLGRIRDELSPD